MKYSFAVFGAILTNLFLLHFLQTSPLFQNLASFYVGVSYIVCSVVMLFVFKLKLNLLSWVDWFCIAGQSILIAIGIIIFFHFKKNVDIGDMTLARALSPTLGMFLAQIASTEQKNAISVFRLFPILILLSIVLLKIDFNISKNIFLFISLLGVYGLANALMRIISKRVYLPSAIILGGVIIGGALIIFNLALSPSTIIGLDLTWSFFLNIFVISLCAFLIQYGTLLGFKKLDQTISTVLISATIPVSLLFSREQNLIIISLAILYLVSVSFLILFRQNEVKSEVI